MNVDYKLAGTIGLAFTFVCTNALAGGGAIYNFSMTFDGTSATLDGGSTDPDGVDLSVGDMFTIDLHAAGPNEFWQVDSEYSEFFPLTFAVEQSATRTGNISSSFLLNGLEVFSINEPGESQQFVHVGTQEWTLPAGLQFDTILMGYELQSSDSALNTITTDINPDIFSAFGDSDRPFFRHPDISYVPEPTTLTLLAVGLATFAWRRVR